MAADTRLGLCAFTRMPYGAFSGKSLYVTAIYYWPADAYGFKTHEADSFAFATHRRDDFAIKNQDTDAYRAPGRVRG